MSAINTNNPQQQSAGTGRKDEPLPNGMSAETFVQHLCIVICDLNNVGKLQNLLDSTEYLTARIVFSPKLTPCQRNDMTLLLRKFASTTETTIERRQKPKPTVSVVNNFDSSTYVENMGSQTVNNAAASDADPRPMMRPDAPTGHRPETEQDAAENH